VHAGEVGADAGQRLEAFLNIGIAPDFTHFYSQVPSRLPPILGWAQI
jgi:hypothetical protein